MNTKQLKQYVEKTWDDSIIPALVEYIKIPNKSPIFDAKWKANGYMDQAMQLLYNWCEQHAVKDMQMEIVQLPGLTPLLFIDIPGQIDDTVLLYGHMDKQPEMVGWEPDLGPWKPVLRGDKLYGRGGADDGYSTFASLTAVKALQEQGIPHARCVIIIEGSEESGSEDLPEYIEHLQDRIGKPSLVVCLDSGASNYKQLWVTTNLRGLIGGELTVKILTEGVHSGYASGIVPSVFRIVRQLLSRIEDEATGEMLLPELKATIPQQRIEQARVTAQVVGEGIVRAQPFVTGAKPMGDDITDLILNRSWRAALAITGIEGIPALENAGSVLLPSISVMLSLRLPPTCDSEAAVQAVKKALEADPPYNAHVEFQTHKEGAGWNAPDLAPWLENALAEASEAYFAAPAMYLGEGGSIPFMGMLGRKFPEAQFFITGVLGPKSNAHGPNEFLHIPMGKNLTCCVAHVLAKHFARS